MSGNKRNKKKKVGDNLYTLDLTKSDRTKVDVLRGEVLSKIESNQDRILFTTEGGERYLMYHIQDCYESVWIEDIDGDLGDLVGKPIVVAEEVTYRDNEMNKDIVRNTVLEENAESFTWTFYKFRTIKGDVTIRWFGSSSGYYSESVDFEKLN